MDIPEEALPSEPTQDGHHELKKTKKKSQPESLSSRHLFEAEADSNCNGKSVHGQGKSNGNDNKKIHLRSK
jgi:hypothetical protein